MPKCSIKFFNMSYLNVWFGLAVVIDPCWLIAIIAKITAVYELMIKDD